MKKLLLFIMAIFTLSAISNSGLQAQEAPKTITVKWKNTLGWANMSIYVWNASGTLTSGWPGTSVTVAADGWYSYTFTGQESVNVIFNNGDNTEQTSNIENIAGDICYEITNGSGVKQRGVVSVDCPENVKVSVSMSPAGGDIYEATPVVLSATNGTAPVSIYYTLDGTIPSATSTLYDGSPITVSETTTVKAIAIDADNTSSDVVTGDFVLKTPVTVKWKDDNNWDAMYIYTWDANGYPTGAWPGTQINVDGEWYSYVVPSDNFKAIFHNNKGSQTVNSEDITSDRCFEIQTTQSSGKYNCVDTTCPQLVRVAVSMSPVGGDIYEATQVVLSSTNGVSPVAIYYTLDGTIPSATSTLYDGSPITVSETTTVKAIAIDADNTSSDVVTGDFVLKTPVTVKWKDDNNWDAMYIYTWDSNGSPTGAWPGTQVNIDGEWYSYVVPSDNFNIIFNNGNGKPQTLNITNVTQNTCFNLLTTTELNEGKDKNNWEIIDCSVPVAQDVFEFRYGADVNTSYEKIEFTESITYSEEGKYTITLTIPDTGFDDYQCYVAYNNGSGEPTFVDGMSNIILIKDISGFKKGKVILTVNKSSASANWGLVMTPDGTTGLNIDKTTASYCYVVDNTIHAKFEGTENIKVYSITGALVGQTIATEETSIDVASGLYIVKIGEKSLKVSVK